MLPTVAIAEPATVVAVAPASVYSSIESCTASLTPAVFGPTDTVTLTTSFSGPVGAFFAVGADNLGADYASVVLPSTFAVVLSLPVPEFALMFGLAPGSHTMDMYAVSADGLAVGEPLCSVSYEFGRSVVEFTGDIELPRGVVGQPYRASTGSMVWGPGAMAVDPRSGSCDLELVSFAERDVDGSGGSGGVGGNGGNGGAGGDGNRYYTSPAMGPTGVSGNGGNGGAGGLFDMPYESGDPETESSTPPFGPLFGMQYESGDPEIDCGTFFGTPMAAGTYTLRQTGYFLCPSTVEPKGVLSPSSVSSQTYAVSRLLTWVVDPAVTPTFTG
jgi:hypothetical protein